MGELHWADTSTPRRVSIRERRRLMGMLLNSETGDRVMLRGNHVFGRNALRSDTVLPDPEASLLHAVLRWRDGHWFVTDHSRNGCTLDGRRLNAGEPAALALGQVLR